jgi:uncharacterized membrane protein YqjE
VSGLDRPPPEAAGPLGAARSLGASLLTLAGVRLELVSLEISEANERNKRLLLLAFGAALFLGSGLLLFAFLVVVLFWDTYRLPAIAAVTLVYSGIGAWAFIRFRQIVRDSPPPLSATLGEFRKDLDMIRGSDG